MGLCKSSQVLGELREQPGADRHVLDILPQVEGDAVQDDQSYLLGSADLRHTRP